MTQVAIARPPTALNGANEIAVNAFLEDKICYGRISEIIYEVMSKHKIIKNPSLEDILATDLWAREVATEVI